MRCRSSARFALPAVLPVEDAAPRRGGRGLRRTVLERIGQRERDRVEAAGFAIDALQHFAKTLDVVAGRAHLLLVRRKERLADRGTTRSTRTSAGRGSAASAGPTTETRTLSSSMARGSPTSETPPARRTRLHVCEAGDDGARTKDAHFTDP